jgi:hypothetical protein
VVECRCYDLIERKERLMAKYRVVTKELVKAKEALADNMNAHQVAVDECRRIVREYLEMQ